MIAFAVAAAHGRSHPDELGVVPARLRRAHRPGCVVDARPAQARGRRRPLGPADPRPRGPAGRGRAVALTAKRRISTIVLEESCASSSARRSAFRFPLLPGGQEVRARVHVHAAHGAASTSSARSSRSGATLSGSRSGGRSWPSRQRSSSTRRPSSCTTASCSREWEDPPIRPPVSQPWPTGFEFYGMRDYVDGDDPRRIVWRKTAQMLDEHGNGRYLVRESEQGITDRVNLFLDTDAEFHSPGDPSETFELAVRVAASLGARHLNDGFSVSVDVNSARLVDPPAGAGQSNPAARRAGPGGDREATPGNRARPPAHRPAPHRAQRAHHAAPRARDRRPAAPPACSGAHRS